MNRRSLLQFAGVTALASVAGGEQAAAFAQAGSAGWNQTGYLPGREKIVTVPAPKSREARFSLWAENSINATGASGPFFQAALSAPMLDEASGDRVCLADFSACIKPGRYRLAIENKAIAQVSIGPDVYRDPLRIAMRSYYGQRCGCAVDLGKGYRHPACHKAGAFHRSSGRTGAFANHGGWHDAGDYGRYVVNSGITVGTLLWAWELYPQALRGLALSIPESGGKMPDYLAEVRWNLEWMLSLQDQDGGVWHKQTSEQFCGFVMPEQDKSVSYIIGTGSEPYKSTGATADLAAVAAIAARCYGEYDSPFASHCLAAAKRAFAWAVAHPNVPFSNPSGVATGGYDTRLANDSVLWAAAELWRTTGDPQYEHAYLDGCKALPPEMSLRAPSWGSVAPMAHWTYAMAGALADRKGDEAMTAAIHKQTAIQAESLIARRTKSGYGNTLANSEYVWGSNSTALNQSLLLLMAHHFARETGTGSAQTLDAALGNLHYVLGRNCFGVSWVTQVGSNPFQHPHHRPSAADGIDAPWPGLLSGGPNAHPADEAARTLPKMPPMRMWFDDERAYSMNEIAINWNAPLVFVLAAADAVES